jgi:hypothetical protein
MTARRPPPRRHFASLGIQWDNTPSSPLGVRAPPLDDNVDGTDLRGRGEICREYSGVSGNS